MFKIGDLVTYVSEDSSTNPLIVEKQYKVTEVTRGFVMVDDIVFWYRSSRFKKVPMTTQLNKKAKPSAKQEADQFFVYKIGGGSPKVVHNTYEDAKNEATRLATANPNNEYVVLGVLYSVKAEPVFTMKAEEYACSQS